MKNEMKSDSERPDLSEYCVANRQLAEKLIAKSRDPQRVYREFRRERRSGRTSGQTTLELAHALAELVAGKRWDEDQPAPLTPELQHRAAVMVCKLMAGPAPAHLWPVTRNQFTTCDECEADIAYQTWLCEECKAAKAA